MIKSFEDYLDKANAAQSNEELFNVYLNTVQRHGFDRALFALMTDHDDLEQKAGVGVMHNFPSDWMEYYFEKGLDKIDPVVSYGATQLNAYQWDDIPRRLDLTKRQKTCLNYGRESGLNNGVATYLRAENNAVAGISLATSEKSDAFDGRTDLITAYSNHFYIRYREINGIKKQDPINIVLTDREREVLTWMAAGKSNGDIATILNISSSGVDFHVKSIFKKFDANSRVLVVVKAISYGMISP